MGAHLNGYTSREQTAYYIKALSKDVPKGRMASGQSLICTLIKCMCFSDTSNLSNQGTKLQPNSELESLTGN